METKPVAKTRTVISAVLGCLAIAASLLSAYLLVKACFCEPSELVSGSADIAEKFRIEGHELIAEAVDIFLLFEVMFYSLAGAVSSLVLGLAAVILSFNRFPGRLNLLGRITGGIGVIYGALFTGAFFGIY